MKKMTYFFVVTALNCAVFVWASRSQQPKTEKVVYQKNTKLDFEARDVDGQFISPDGKDVEGEKNIYFDSMLEERKSFKKEMTRSSRAIR
jgi:predicted ATP-grasp superfamily ATP-dependent carboligase